MSLLSTLFRRRPPAPPTAAEIARLESAIRAQEPHVQALMIQNREYEVGAGIVRFREACKRNADAVRRGERLRDARGRLLTKAESDRRAAALNALGLLDGELLDLSCPSNGCDRGCGGCG